MLLRRRRTDEKKEIGSQGTEETLSRSSVCTQRQSISESLCEDLRSRRSQRLTGVMAFRTPAQRQHPSSRKLDLARVEVFKTPRRHNDW